VVENNYSGQLARHIRAETGFTVDGKILKYDGEPFEPHHIVAHVKEILYGNSR
jgi:2-oxoglutarate ferredoxin oxidoreductase subunit alpha